MSLTRRIAQGAATLLVIGAALLAGMTALTPTPAHAVVDPSIMGPTTAEAADRLFLITVAPGTHLTRAQQRAMLAMSDRVCEGFVADVSIVSLASVVARTLNVDGATARLFVNTTATVRC